MGENNKVNVLFWIGVKSKGELLQKKHGGFKYLDISKECWQFWCRKNDVLFYEYHIPSLEDTTAHKPTWQRWFDVFKQLDQSKINYDKIAVIDGSTLVRWDCPNFFDLCENNQLYAFRSLENLRWISQGVFGYKEFFNKFDFDLTKYISCGFQVFDKNHRLFLEKLKLFYEMNYDSIMELQNKQVKRGTDQPVYNYLLQIEGVDVKSLPPDYFLNHMYRFDWMGHNWQLKNKTPFFIKYGKIWCYSGFPNRGDRYNLMKQTWDLVKSNY